MDFEWNDSYKVGVENFDEQHKKLFHLLNTLFKGIKEGKKKETMGQVLNELLEYTIYHFSAEEELMEKHQYPELARHKLEHENFTGKVERYYEGFHTGIAPLTADVLGFLVSWLKNHIAETDKHYSSFFNEKGVS